MCERQGLWNSAFHFTPPHLVFSICSLKVYTTTIMDTNQEAEIINTTERSSILHIALKTGATYNKITPAQSINHRDFLSILQLHYH
jgi:hypothetical protein